LSVRLIGTVNRADQANTQLVVAARTGPDCAHR